MVDVALQQMEAMLRALMSTDNAVRNQAEEALAQARQAPDSLFSALIAMLRSNQDEQVRSLAAVLLRKEIIRLLAQSADAQGVTVSTQVKALLKSELLACIEQEPQRSIRKKASDVVGQLAINIMSNDPSGWPELFPWMLEGTRSTNVPLHEAALAIFNTLSEFIAEKMAAHHGMLLDVFRSSLQAQQELSVRNAALRALASFLMALSEPSQRVPFQELVPLMLQTISDALARGMEDECREALEVFVEVAESQTKFLKRHLAECVTGMIAIASNTSLDDSLRHLALEFLLTIAEGAPTLARKMPRFCADTVPVALAMMLELECDTAQELQEWEDEDEDEESEEEVQLPKSASKRPALAPAAGGAAKRAKPAAVGAKPAAAAPAPSVAKGKAGVPNGTPAKATPAKKGAAATPASGKGGAAAATPSGPNTWAAAEDAKLKKALSKFGPETPSRWKKVAEEVGSRSEDQCKKRNKALAKE
mmetsp:Transcript_45155/g.145302  ORF Transcript_45155/g.145302 Transcript_45155/m.145302 type:complete len:478 (-) Transcript_45155:377-1810(-)